MIPILMYHRIADVANDRNSTRVELFEKELDYLVAKGFATISLHDCFAGNIEGKPLPQKSIVLTFDDASLDTFTEAMPRLLARGMTATVFPIAEMAKTGAIYSGGKQPVRTMSIEQLKDWRDAGLEIGSHGLLHRNLVRLSPPEYIEELTASKSFFENALQIPIEFFCYPYGTFTTDISLQAQKAGYTGALAISENLPFGNFSPYAMPRLISSGKQPFWEFKLKTSFGYRSMLLARTIEYRIRMMRRKLMGRA